MTVLGVTRAEQFSPNSIEKDRIIMDAVVNRLHGYLITEEEAAVHLPQADIYLNMARGAGALARLKEREEQGALVLNSAYGVEACRRSSLDLLMRRHHLPVPPREGSDGYWLKRGDGAAQCAEDVVFCADKDALEAARNRFAVRGITDVIVQAHVKGDLVKCYGVEGTDFFRVFYPGDDGESKFGDEEINGIPRHYSFQRQQLQASAEFLSRLTRTPVYGSDAIITPQGDFVWIDFNDWPSFSRCREEAAEAIVSWVKRRFVI